jgi:hypothetical protein
MSSTSKKQPKEEPLVAKIKYFFLATIRFVVSGSRDYLSLRFWVIVIAVVILIFMGDLFTKSGLVFISFVLVYILLNYLDKWLEKRKEK